MARPAIFLDRDGTINVEKNYLHRIEDWEWIPGTIEAIKLINKMGFLAIVVTNQSGVARGYYSEGDVKALHNQVDDVLLAYGAKIDAYYCCPHHPEFGENRDCVCRKPKSGMLISAAADFDIDLSASWMIGDKISDVFAGINANISSILVRTGYGKDQLSIPTGVSCSENLLAAVISIARECGYV